MVDKLSGHPTQGHYSVVSLQPPIFPAYDVWVTSNEVSAYMETIPSMKAGVPALSVSKSVESHSYWFGFFQSHKFSRRLRMTLMQSVALSMPGAYPESPYDFLGPGTGRALCLHLSLVMPSLDKLFP